MSGPWAFDPHPAAWGVVLGLVAGWAVLVAHLASGTTSRRRCVQMAAAAAALAAAVTWPVGDLAAHWSLTALVLQRLLLVLVVAPLLLLATPPEVLSAVTRPRAADRLLEIASRPAVAVVVVSAVAWATLAVPAVEAQAHDLLARAGADALLLASGFVLWAPVLRHIPGASRPSPVGTAAYLFVQSVLPTFPAVVFVLARHPFYPVFSHVHGALGLSPLADQQLAGIVAKVGTLPVLWGAAWLALTKAERLDRAGDSGDPLLWSDVARRLERAERRQRSRRHPHPARDWRPRPLTSALPVVDSADSADDASGHIPNPSEHPPDG